MVNFDDANCYPTTSATGDFDFYPSLNFGLADEEGRIRSAGHWDVIGQPDPMADPSTDALAPNNHGEHYDHHLVSSIGV
jgi:hypothetical protein